MALPEAIRAWLPTRRRNIVRLVTVVAVLFAVVTYFVAWFYRLELGANFLLILAVGVDVPRVYDDWWPVVYPAATAVAWTLGTVVVTIVVFLGTYWLLDPVLPGFWPPVTAFMLTSVLQFGGAYAYARLLDRTDLLVS